MGLLPFSSGLENFKVLIFNRNNFENNHSPARELKMQKSNKKHRNQKNPVGSMSGPCIQPETSTSFGPLSFFYYPFHVMDTGGYLLLSLVFEMAIFLRSPRFGFFYNFFWAGRGAFHSALAIACPLPTIEDIP